MKEINPSKIKRAELVVGIPSYNESDSIVNVVKQVDIGLQKYFKNRTAVIINADNHSPDNTKQAFLKSRTQTPKIYISTPPEVLGKGNNIHNLFEKASALKASTIMTIDADLKNISPEWIKCFLSAIKEGYDFVLPIYRRNKLDGSITNQICFPLLYGLLGHKIRQPIGGDMAFSGIFYKNLLEKKWTNQVSQFGIDIFITLNAIKGGFKICQTDLGAKNHKPSAPKLGPMFIQVTNTFFKILLENKKLWENKITIVNPPIVCKLSNKQNRQKLKMNYGHLRERALFDFSRDYKFLEKYLSKDVYRQIEPMFFQTKKLKINTSLWMKIIYDMLFAYGSSGRQKQRVIRALRSLYFARMVTFTEETLKKTQEESEQIIQRQAKLFYKNRNYLLTK